MVLEHVKGDTWVLKGQALIPLFRLDRRRCVLLDSGSLEEREKLTAALDREGLTPAAVLGSHAHIDHMGNHRFLKEKYGAQVILSLGEAARMSSPLGLLQQYPALDLADIPRYPELAEVCCPPDRVILPGEKTVTLWGADFSILPTPGHTPDHICVRTPDGVLYAADSVRSEKVRARSKLLYTLSVTGYLNSLDRLAQAPGGLWVLAHRAVCEGTKDLLEGERADVIGRMEELFARSGGARDPRTLTKTLCAACRITPDNRRHLAYLDTVSQGYLHYFRSRGWLEEEPD